MSSTEVAIVVVVVVVVVALLAAVWLNMRRQALKKRFGPEYGRLAEERGQAAAGKELRERERRHDKLELRPLTDASRQRYQAAWTELQTRFVDQPEETVASADQLVTQLVAERGYPTDDYDEQLAQLSVDHARTLDHYRYAHDVYLRHQHGAATTDQLREALVHYRALVADVLGTNPVSHGGDSYRPADVNTQENRQVRP